MNGFSFAIYQLRLGYLNHIRDGVGERLINLNPAILNNPAFRTAGWTPDVGAIKRCHSPPIPTCTSDIKHEYFQRPRRAYTIDQEEVEVEEGDGRGMVTGVHGSEDTLGPAGLQANERKRERRRRKEQQEDDSSDLTDDSDDEVKGPLQGIRFDRMPTRSRAKSSPPTRPTTSRGNSEIDSPAVMVTSPSRPTTSRLDRPRGDSFSALEGIRTRPRRDTTTSSEISSENEYAPEAVRSGRPGKNRSMLTLQDKIKEEDEQEDIDELNSDLEDDTDVGEHASDLSDVEFEGTAGSASLIGLGAAAASDNSSSSVIKPPLEIIPAITPANSSPKKFPREALPKLPRLPTGQRPQSMAQSVSMLSMLINGKNGGSKHEKPFQHYADLSGKGEASPLWIKIYAPFSDRPSDPIEVPMRKTKDDKAVTVAELIGLALWRYEEEEYKPAIKPEESNINWWTLRIVEDDEIDFDFPALARTRPVIDFTSNNNRPPQRRARDKPWDEFGLVKATDEQFAENELLTPQPKEGGSAMPSTMPTPKLEATKLPVPGSMMRNPSDLPPASMAVNNNPITKGIFGGGNLRKDSTVPLMDMPQSAAPRGATRTGPACTVLVQYTDPQTFITRNEQFETTADSYIGDIFEQSCIRLNLDKASHVLKLHGTSTVAPNDRLIETLGDKLHLNLVQKRFQDIGPLGVSPANSISPDTPIDAKPGPTKVIANPETIYRLANDGGGKRYNVIRKQPLSFAAPHPRTLIITPDYMTIMPAAPDSLAAPIGKITNVAMSSVIGAKVSRRHPLIFKIFVMRNKETKRYDFEAKSKAEAESAVADVRKGMKAAGGGSGAADFAVGA